MWKNKARYNLIIYVQNLSKHIFIFKRNIPRENKMK